MRKISYIRRIETVQCKIHSVYELNYEIEMFVNIKTMAEKFPHPGNLFILFFSIIKNTKCALYISIINCFSSFLASNHDMMSSHNIRLLSTTLKTSILLIHYLTNQQLPFVLVIMNCFHLKFIWH